MLFYLFESAKTYLFYDSGMDFLLIMSYASQPLRTRTILDKFFPLEVLVHCHTFN